MSFDQNSHYRVLELAHGIRLGLAVALFVEFAVWQQTASARTPDTDIAARCRTVTAPASFEIASSGRRGTTPGNEGIKPNGFVELASDGPVVHGIDVSKYQEEADFASVRTCGGRFAYVRMSGGSNAENELLYRTHWANVRASGLIPGPYHNLTIIPQTISHVQDRSMEAIRAETDRLSSEARASASQQAELFLSRLREVLALDPGGSSEYLPIALDLSARPGAPGDAQRRRLFGPVYSSAICEFMNVVGKSPYASRPIILFAELEDLDIYGLDESTRRCAPTTPLIWVRHRPMDGRSFMSSKPRDLVERICLQEEPAGSPLLQARTGAGRCVMEQYTSFGGFAIFKPGAPLDLNRFFGTEDDFRRFWQTGRMK
ncbi:glycoside hydrolase [Microvirga terrae]|uniref:Glycoside hydrolase n=1 Tax=Microvirga terrae TaxID=2740529 RepID=A0ABY5RR91_9HYPH|nr:GH25 family lysozyme [Microvirga terrae]UVF18829.1 glycoside hydrolase [Microvirga terrae]